MARNKLIVLVLILSIFTASLLPLASIFADPNSNLVLNPGFETNNNNPLLPDSWATDSWGNNSAQFAYLNTGHSGSHSVQTTLSNYQNGDAKWIFSPVSVVAGQQYLYNDWYQSTTSTNIWARYTLSNATVQFSWLGSESASANWSQSNLTLTVPSDVTSVSMFHVINSNGTLTLDDASFSQQASCNVSEANGVYNGGFEQSCPSNPNMPAAWGHTTYGNPRASFNYTSQSHSGNFAVQTTMQNSNGEAGWHTDWQVAASNQRYNLNFWQNGSTYVYAYIAVKLNDGSFQYISLMSVPPTLNTGWSQYSDSFVTPSNTSAIQVTIATSAPGTFFVDDVYLTPLSNQIPLTFNRGVVSLTFDDGNASTYTNGFNDLKNYGLSGTFYLNGSTIGSKGYMTASQVKIMASSGQEIASHQYDHINQTLLSQAQLTYELTQNNTMLQNILGPAAQITDFASPYGAYTSSTVDTVMQYYQSDRTTDGMFNTKANLNVKHIHAILVTSSTSPKQVESWINQSVQQNEWLVLVYHAIGSIPPGGDGQGYSTSPSNFLTEVKYLQQTGVNVLPINAALNTLFTQQ